jgi:hypothetical protein
MSDHLLTGRRGLITSIWRFNVFWHVNSFQDVTYAGGTLVIWTQLEPGCYLISACMLTWHPLVDIASKWITGVSKTVSSTRPPGPSYGPSYNLKSSQENGDSKIVLRPLPSSIVYKSSVHSQGFRRIEGSKNNITVTTDFVRDEEDLEMNRRGYGAAS